MKQNIFLHFRKNESLYKVSIVNSINTSYKYNMNIYTNKIFDYIIIINNSNSEYNFSNNIYNIIDNKITVLTTSTL